MYVDLPKDQTRTKMKTTKNSSSSLFFTLLLIITCNFVGIVLCNPTADDHGSPSCQPMDAEDEDLLHFALNIEWTEAEYFTIGSFGKGVDSIAPQLAMGGPPSIGARKADLDGVTQQIMGEFGLQEVGHLRAITDTVGGIKRPLVNLSPKNFGTLMEQAVGHQLEPPFDPFANTINYLLAAYVLPYVGLNGYVGTIPLLRKYKTKRLTAGLLGVEAEQDAVIRALLYVRGGERVEPYDITVAEFTNRISILRNQLGMCGIKDEGLIVPKQLGAENMTESNIISADYYSLSYARTPQEILRIMYDTGSERKLGGFFPEGANGKIARSFLDEDGEDSLHD